MLRTICICTVMMFSFFGNSQSEVDVNITINSEVDEKKVNPFFNEIGIGTSIITQFLQSNEEATNQNPFFLTYKLGYKNSALRFGVGGKLDESTRYVDGTTDKVTNKRSNYDLRLGYEYRVPIGKKWLGTFGADFVIQQSFDELISESGFDRVVIANNQKGQGGGIALGVQYALTERLMLGTEAAFYYMKVEQKKATTFETLPQFNSDPEITDDRITQSLLPSSIYLIFHF